MCDSHAVGLNWIESRYTIEWRTIYYTCERLVVSPMNKSMIPWMAWGNVYRVYDHIHTIHRWCQPIHRNVLVFWWSFMRIFYFKSGINCAIEMTCAFHNSSKTKNKTGTATTEITFVFGLFFIHFPVHISPSNGCFWDALSSNEGERDHRAMEKLYLKMRTYTAFKITGEFMRKKICIYIHALWTTEGGREVERERLRDSQSCIISANIISVFLLWFLLTLLEALLNDCTYDLNSEIVYSSNTLFFKPRLLHSSYSKHFFHRISFGF